MQKKQVKAYNDGMMYLYKRKTEKNVRGLEDLMYVSKLAFEEKTIRQQDVEFALQRDRQLTMKVVTHDDGNMDTSRCAVIGNVIYGIIDIDRNKKDRELYFYLQEMKKIDQ